MKSFLKYTIWLGLAGLLIVPFIVSNQLFFPYITGKAFAFRLIVEIILALWLILIIKDEEYRPKFSWIITVAGIFTLVLLIADINAVAPFKAFWGNFERMEGWVTIIHLFAYLLVLGSILTTEKMWLWFLRANVAAGLIMAVTSLDNTEVRFSGPLGNPIYISVYFLFIFFFTLLLWYKDALVKKNILKNSLFYIYPLVAILSFYVTYRTSRGVLLGAIGGLLITALLTAVFEKERKWLRKISIGLIITVAVIIVGFLGARETQFVKNNPTLSRLAAISWTNVHGQARQYIWPMAINGFKEKPILGWGQEGFNYVFNKYYDSRMYAQEQWFDRAHNAPLDFLIAGGILGLLSYLALFISALYLLWFRKTDLAVVEKALITGLLGGYFFQGLFVFDNLISYIMFFTVLAYVHSHSVVDQTRKKSFQYFSNFVQNKEYQNYILIPLVIILAGFGLWRINYPAWSANKNLITAMTLTQSGQIEAGITAFNKALSYHSLADSEIREQIISLAPPVAQANGLDDKSKEDFINLAFVEGNKQIEWVPADARYYILTGSFLNSIGYPEKALPYVQQAVALSPRKQTMRFALIQALVNLGRIEEAVTEAKAAYELDTSFDQAKSIYDKVLKLKTAKPL